MQNDIKHYKQLEQMDIKVIVIWECELKKCFDYRMESLLEEIKMMNSNLTTKKPASRAVFRIIIYYLNSLEK